MHILSPETYNCPYWISGRERMTVENTSWSSSTKECCRPRRGLNPWPPGLQSDSASNWHTEAGYIPSNVSIQWNDSVLFHGILRTLWLAKHYIDFNQSWMSKRVYRWCFLSFLYESMCFGCSLDAPRHQYLQHMFLDRNISMFLL